MSYITLREVQQTAGAIFMPEESHETIVHYGDSQSEYNAVVNSAAVIDSSTLGRLWMRDRDRSALLHRLSTNTIEELEAGQGTQTVLTNHNGRIIDLLTVHVLPEQLLIVTSAQQRSTVFHLLRNNIFFNDKVKLEDASDNLGQLMLYGPRSAEVLQTLTGTSVMDLPLHAITSVVLGTSSVWIARSQPLGGDGFALYVSVSDLPQVWTSLLEAGTHPLGAVAFDILRVEAGYGIYGRELSLEYIPLETGLWHAISFSKGCYVGQEIIARMESRNRLAKQLRGLKLTAPVDVTSKLDVSGKEAGELTSVVFSPRFGPIALAYIRTAYAEPGTTVNITGGDITGEVVLLPFAS